MVFLDDSLSSESLSSAPVFILSSCNPDAIERQGRPTLDEAQERNRGVERRNELRDNLARAGLARPTNNERNAANNDRHNRMVID